MQTLGYSASAVLVSMLVAVALLGLSTYLAFKRAGRGMPMISTCSIAISAACHRGLAEDVNVAERPLQYGLLREGAEGELRVGFSADEVEPLPVYMVRTGPGERVLEKTSMGLCPAPTFVPRAVQVERETEGVEMRSLLRT